MCCQVTYPELPFMLIILQLIIQGISSSLSKFPRKLSH